MSKSNFGDRAVLSPIWRQAFALLCHAERAERAARAHGDTVTAEIAASAAKHASAAMDALSDEPAAEAA